MKKILTLSRTIRGMTLILSAMFLVFSIAWAQDAPEEAAAEPATEMVEVVAETPAEPTPVPEPPSESVPESEVPEVPEEAPSPPDNMLTMLFVIIVSPIVTGFLRRFNVANSMYQPINALFSVALFIAWWYFFANAEAAGLQEWIIRGLAAAGISGALMSVAGRKTQVVSELKQLTGTGKGK